MNTGYEHIDQMMKRSQKFYIEIGDFSLENQVKTLEFTYNRNDEIFNLAEANSAAANKQKGDCNCCEVKYKKISDAKYCDFCALAFCFRCRAKTRVFPMCNDKSQGSICKICDRKFYIRDIIKDKQVQI